jgi:cytochrome b involved in lipid metabolism
VAAHGTEEDCWTSINGNVYDVSAFFGHHPGGDRNILKLCGKDGTAAFERQHGGSGRANSTLEDFIIGTLAN